MKIKEEYEIEYGTRHRWFNYYRCDCCDKEYKKQKRIAEGAPREHYCSTACYTEDKKPNRVTLECAHCGISFTRPQSKINNSRSGLYFCCREHKDIGQTYIKEIQPEHYGSSDGSASYRAKALRHKDNACCVCGYTNVNALEVHHIDRDRSNNDLSNLIILCANCHTLEHKGFLTGLCTGVQR